MALNPLSARMFPAWVESTHLESAIKAWVCQPKSLGRGVTCMVRLRFAAQIRAHQIDVFGVVDLPEHAALRINLNALDRDIIF